MSVSIAHLEDGVTLEQIRAIAVEQGWSLRVKKCWGKDYVLATKGDQRVKEQKCLGLLENLERVLAYARTLSDPPLASSPLGEPQVFFTQRSSWRKAQQVNYFSLNRICLIRWKRMASLVMHCAQNFGGQAFHLLNLVKEQVELN